MVIPLLGSRSIMSFATLNSARNIVRQNMKIKPGEAVLVVSDSSRPHIADAIAYAILEINGKHRTTHNELAMIFMKPREAGRREPPRSVANAMKASDVVLITTRTSITFSEAAIQATENARIASLPGVTEEMMINGGLRADYEEVKRMTDTVATFIEKTDKFKVTSPNGTRITFNRGDRRVLRDDGDFSEKGKIGNLPAGEACFAIPEDSANGILVLDRMGSTLMEPTKLKVKNGKIVDIIGPGEKLREIIERQKKKGDLNADTIAEFGVGTNPMARYIECQVEAEKMYGTVHFGIGSNKALPGGLSESGIHRDGVILDVKLEVNGGTILDGRKFYI